MSDRWWEGPMLAFDTETTGPDPESARIVQACATLIRSDGEPVVSQWLVDPGVDIPAEATAVHGITTEQVRAHGLAPHLAVKDIHATLTGIWGLGFPVVIMNAPYDLTVLDRELIRHCGYGLGEAVIDGSWPVRRTEVLGGGPAGCRCGAVVWVPKMTGEQKP